MRLYAIYSAYLKPLKDEWFLPSLKDDFELRMTEAKEHGGPYRSEGFARAVMEKTDCIISAIRENTGSCFVYSDVDIQFFRPVAGLLRDAIAGLDIVCQRDAPPPTDTMCSGFFVMQANKKSLSFWQRVRTEAGKDGRDQRVFNAMIRKRTARTFWRPALQYGYLPTCFFGGGTLTGKQWVPGMTLQVPQDIVLHHANYTVGIDNKIAQLQHVRAAVEARGARQPKNG